MNIIIKYVITSMRERKIRTFLIIFSVAISGALFFASSSISNTMVNIYTKQARESIGNADIIIKANTNSPSTLVGTSLAMKLVDDVDYIIPVIRGSGLYDVGNSIYDEMSLMGIDLQDYKTMNEISFKEIEKDGEFIANKIIISDRTAQKYNWKVGDTVELQINEQRRRLQIYGISESVGVFANETNSMNVMLPYTALTTYLETDKKPNNIYIKGKSGADINSLIQMFSNLYPKYTVEEAINRNDLEEQVSWISMPLLLMTIVVTFMSVFIVYTSFRVIMLEKLPNIGTFRSVGASKKMMNRVLILESIFYGVIGGLCACVLGIGTLYIMTIFMSQGSSTQIDIIINPVLLIEGFLIGVVICIVSSMFPIKQISKLPVKEIVLGNNSTYKKESWVKNLEGIVYIAISIILPEVVKGKLNLVVAIVGLILSIIGVIKLLPGFVNCIAKALTGIFRVVFGNIGVLGIKNIKGNKSILNSMSLICIGVGVILMINNISTNLTTQLLDVYANNLVYDMEVTMTYMDKYKTRSMLDVDGVEDVCGNYLSGSYMNNPIEVEEFDGASLGCVLSVVGLKFDDFMKMNYASEQERDMILEKINEGRYIALSNTLRKRYDLKKGDTLTLKMSNCSRTYTIIGFYDTIVYMGNHALIGEKYLKQDLGVSQYSVIYINVDEGRQPEEVLSNLKQIYSDEKLNGQTNAEMRSYDQEQNDIIFSLLIGFSMLAVIIGIVGVINNLLISFIERQKSLAVLRSVGMNKKQMIKMIFIEAIYLGLFGSIAGCTTGGIIMKNIPYILEGIGIPISTYMIVDYLWVYIIAALLITVVASIAPVLKTTKLNIIETIKFE